jgi:hypothetical protein
MDKKEGHKKSSYMQEAAEKNEFNPGPKGVVKPKSAD